jgi:hypothetical protein
MVEDTKVYSGGGGGGGYWGVGVAIFFGTACLIQPRPPQHPTVGAKRNAAEALRREQRRAARRGRDDC